MKRVKPPAVLGLWTFAFFVLAGMTSCLGIKADIVMNSDNSGTITLEYRISRALDSLGTLDGNESRPSIPVGRLDMERTAARIPGMKLRSFTSREDERDRIITAKLEFANPETLLGFLDAAGEKAVFAENPKKLTLILNPGGARGNPDLDALIAQIAEGYRVSITMTFPPGGNGNLALLDQDGRALSAPQTGGEINPQGKKVFCSLPLGAVLSAEKGISLEFRW